MRSPHRCVAREANYCLSPPYYSIDAAEVQAVIILGPMRKNFPYLKEPNLTEAASIARYVNTELAHLRRFLLQAILLSIRLRFRIRPSNNTWVIRSTVVHPLL